jgi:polyhydroxyalkanoate synthesis regulator phasin
MADESKKDTSFDPASLVENAFLMGIGVLELTKEKTQGLANELIEKGKMSSGDAKKVADKFSEIAGEQQENMRKTVAEETDKVLKTSGVATKAEMDDLKKQIAELKEMLAGQHPEQPEAQAPDAE